MLNFRGLGRRRHPLSSVPERLGWGRQAFHVKMDVKAIVENMNAAGAGGFFGGFMPSVLHTAESKQHTSHEFGEALKSVFLESDGTNDGKDFYKIQSLQFLGDKNDIVRVPIWIARKKGNSSSFVSIAPAWLGYLEHAMNEINRASPGLFLYLTNDVSKAKVRIYGSSKGCFTYGNILEPEVVDIHLEATWNGMKRTSCHELLHALGILHEHQRNDRGNSIDVLNTGSQCCKYDYLLGVTRFDPFSIMLYVEGDHFLRRSCDSVWFTKPNAEINREMSQLDKVTLNNLYRPCKGPRYCPSKGITGLFYCGRYVYCYKVVVSFFLFII